MLPVKAITLMDLLSPILWLVNELTGGYPNRRRVRVQVHTAYVKNGHPTPYCFVNVTNRSSKRAVQVTHVWFATNPPVHIVNPYRPLPVRLHSHESWKTWIQVARLPDVPGWANSAGSVSPATTQFSHDQTAPPSEAVPPARP